MGCWLVDRIIDGVGTDGRWIMAVWEVGCWLVDWIIDGVGGGGGRNGRPLLRRWRDAGGCG